MHPITELILNDKRGRIFTPLNWSRPSVGVETGFEGVLISPVFVTVMFTCADISSENSFHEGDL